MTKKISSRNLYIGESKIPNAGRGVFAGEYIKTNEIIEVCPVIEIPRDDTANLGESILVTYLFFYGKNKDQAFVALGFGSIYNHTDNPNAICKINEKQKNIKFFALRDIKIGEEITFDYNFGKLNNQPLWFESV